MPDELLFVDIDKKVTLFPKISCYIVVEVCIQTDFEASSNYYRRRGRVTPYTSHYVFSV